MNTLQDGLGPRDLLSCLQCPPRSQEPQRQPKCEPRVLCLQTRASPFKDMILCFSEEDWSLLDPAQTGFYGEFIIGEDCGVSVPLGEAPCHFLPTPLPVLPKSRA